MKENKLFKLVMVCALVFLFAVPFVAMSEQMQESGAGQISERIFNSEELEQMLAPIALYPDALLAQVLTAATYPLEVVAADRFVKDNQGLKNEALLEAAKDKDWEPSVKAMLEFPDVLAMMDAQLEWTKRMGDAFLAQRSGCMDSVQRLRQKAYAQGNLTTNKEQVIRVEPQTQIIVIEPASPEVVFVPVYDTTIIYGNWWYPSFPPYYFYPRGFYGITFFPGVFVRAFWGIWGTWGCNWHNRDVYVNIDYYNRFTRVSYTRGDYYWSYRDRQGYQPWKYDSRHRQSARQRDSFTVQRFSGQQSTNLTAKPSTSGPRQYGQVTVRTPTIDLRANVRPLISDQRSKERDQTSIKRISAIETRGGVADRLNAKSALSVDLKSNAGNQRNLRIPVSGPKVQELAKPTTVAKSPKDSVRNQIIAKPTSDDSRRKKDNGDISVAKSKGRIEHAENDDLLPTRQLAPELKDSNVLREGFIRTGGR